MSRVPPGCEIDEGATVGYAYDADGDAPIFESGMLADGPGVRAFVEEFAELAIVPRNGYHHKLPEPTTEPTNICRSCRNSGAGQLPADPEAVGGYAGRISPLHLAATGEADENRA